MDEPLILVRRKESGGCWNIIGIAPDGAETILRRGILFEKDSVDKVEMFGADGKVGEKLKVEGRTK